MNNSASSTLETDTLGPPDGTENEFLWISIIVPVRNEASFISGTLDMLLRQDYPSNAYEILVIDGDSTDATRQIIACYSASWPQVRLLENPQRWSSAARNIGIDASQGQIVVVIDGHCQIENPRHLRNLNLAFQREDVACVGRPQPLDIRDATLMQQAIAAARASFLGHHPDSFIYSHCEEFVPARSVGVAYRRSVFEQVGRFDETFDACEDVEFNHRVDKAGLRCLLVPSVAVHYVPRASLRKLFHQLVRYGRGRMRLLRKHRDTFTWKTFVPALFVAIVLGGIPPACLWPSSAGILYGSFWGVYLLVVLMVSTILSMSRRNLWLLPRLPLVFFVIHFSSGWGILRELFASQSPPPKATAR